MQYDFNYMKFKSMKNKICYLGTHTYVARLKNKAKFGRVIISGDCGASDRIGEGYIGGFKLLRIFKINKFIFTT